MNKTKQRQEAIRRNLSGENQSEISRALGKSRHWVRYWLEQYDPDDPEGSLQDHSRAPKQPHYKWSETIITQVVHSRRLRMAAEQSGYRYALIGAEAIHYELKALGIRPLPPIRTIHHWLKQAGLVNGSQGIDEVEKVSKPYPQLAREQVNDLHQADLKGPFYLQENSQKHYLLALRDYASKKITVDISLTKRSVSIADFLISAWQQLGIPKKLQMDNGLEFRGSNRYPRSFGTVVRLCLDLGIEPCFVPPHEPWRNGFIENFNGLFARLCLKREQFSDEAELRNGVAQFQEAVNTTHRLAALDGQTPQEFAADKALTYLAAEYDWRRRDLQLVKGKISFIRLVRKSGRITLTSNDKFEIGEAFQWQYVLAQVDVTAQQLNIFLDGERIESFDYTLR